MRGIYLDGIVLDEYADMDPRVWAEIIRPALADRQGWAVFIGTPRGRNAFFELWRRAQAEEGWYAMMLRASESGLIAESELALARRDLTEEQYLQEFECSFDAAVVGSYYGKLMARAEADRRIAGVPCDPAALVWTSWDLGIRDATAIWFVQVIGREIRIIDYYEASGVDLGHYVREINLRPYVYGGHIVPHDAQAKELGTGKSRLEVLESLGLRHLSLAPLHRVEDGINAVRMFIPKCWFDATKCARGVDALKLYRADYDDKLQALRPQPVHDWTSHAAEFVPLSGADAGSEGGAERVQSADRVFADRLCVTSALPAQRDAAAGQVQRAPLRSPPRAALLPTSVDPMSSRGASSRRRDRACRCRRGNPAFFRSVDRSLGIGGANPCRPQTKREAKREGGGMPRTLNIGQRSSQRTVPGRSASGPPDYSRANGTPMNRCLAGPGVWAGMGCPRRTTTCW